MIVFYGILVLYYIVDCEILAACGLVEVHGELSVLVGC